MKKEIEEVLKKHLPEQMTGELLKRFNNLEEKERLLDASIATTELLRKDINKLEAGRKSAENILMREKEVQAREKSVLDTIRNQNLKRLQYELEQEKSNTNRIYALAEIVFKSVKPVFTQSLWGTTPVADGHGGILNQPYDLQGTKQEIE